MFSQWGDPTCIRMLKILFILLRNTTVWFFCSKCSHYIPIKFPRGSKKFSLFPKVPKCVPQDHLQFDLHGFTRELNDLHLHAHGYTFAVTQSVNKFGTYTHMPNMFKTINTHKTNSYIWVFSYVCLIIMSLGLIKKSHKVAIAPTLCFWT